MNDKNEILKKIFIIKKENLISPNKQFYYTKNIVKESNNKRIYIFILIFILLFSLLLFQYKIKIYKLRNNTEILNLDKYEIPKYNEIKNELISNHCTQMSTKEHHFINGIIRKYKPKKILEIGVYHGGSSIIILNAINDIQNTKFYSIDLDQEEYVGDCVKKYFPQYLKNWKLFKGNITTEFIEKIGNNIDMVLFDTAHFEPGEILDFLMVLPFLKDEAIVLFHDIAIQIFSKKREEWAPYIIFNGIRGKKFFPSGNYNLKHNIGAIILDKNQNKYYQDYFRLLGGQWQYFPKEIHINLIRKYFQKYYKKECLMIFEEAINFNRNFVKLHPKSIIYNKTSD